MLKLWLLFLISILCLNDFNSIGTCSEQEHDKLVAQKNVVIEQILRTDYPQHSFINQAVLEANNDAVIVFYADNAATPLTLSKQQSYDLVAVRFKNNLYLHGGNPSIDGTLLEALKNHNKLIIE